MTKLKHGLNELRPYAQGDLGRVWDTLTEPDMRELREGGLLDPTKLEHDLTLCGTRLMTWDTEDGVACVYGVTPTGDPRVGLVWALAGTRAHKRWRWIVRHTEDALKEISEGYWVLMNFKDTRNTTQIKWLKRVGFSFINKTRLHPDGPDYLEFVRIMK